MAASRAKKLAYRKKTVAASTLSAKLLQPIDKSREKLKVREKITVPSKVKSALIPGEGRSMGMEID
jgi:large subunit ribosomal protein L24e